MSPIAIGMDMLLAALLGVALILGLRLSAQLKALKVGHLAFAKAVSELDTAAARAEAGLKAIRAAADEAHDSLLTRIETARALTAKLEAATALAEAAPPPVSAKVVELPVASEVRPVRPRATPAPAVKLRPRGLDDDLFEAPEPARNAMRGARA